MRICRLCGVNPREYCYRQCEACRVKLLRALPLTKIQRGILDAFLSGLSNKEIVVAVGANSEKTTSTHKKLVMRKLGASNDVELVLESIRRGYVPGFAFVGAPLALVPASERLAA